MSRGIFKNKPKYGILSTVSSVWNWFHAGACWFILQDPETPSYGALDLNRFSALFLSPSTDSFSVTLRSQPIRVIPNYFGKGVGMIPISPGKNKMQPRYPRGVPTKRKGMSELLQGVLTIRMPFRGGV